MTDLSQIVRWNAGFVRGLAESVLNRAKLIRSTLTAYSDSDVTPEFPPKVSVAAAKKPASKKSSTKRAPARKTASATKRTPSSRRSTKRSDA